MESIGAKLRNTREEKGYTIEQVARDTHIAKRFITAMEDEDFSSFPGEPYLLGFLRNYSDFLGINPQDIINIYRNMKIQEQPAPIEGLIARKDPKKPIFISVAAVVLLGLIGGLIYLFGTGAISFDRPERVSDAETEPEKITRVINFEEEMLEQRIREGTRVVFSLNNIDYTIDITDISDRVNLTYSGIDLSIGADSMEDLDLDNDNKTDLKIIARAVYPEEDSAVLRFDRVIEAPGGTAAEEGSALSETEELEADILLGTASQESRRRESLPVVRASEAHDYFVEIDFRGYALLRYLIDGNQREEKYFKPGDVFRISVRNEFRYWLSNAGVTRVRIAGNPVIFGRPGEVVTGLIRWQPADISDESVLTMVPVY
ncbi:MAG: helix-turn-helix domain-containing protein [Spirochaetia bacterium]